MPAMTLVRNSKRYTHEEWMAMDSDERDQLLAKYGPAYTDEAWKLHHGNQNPRRNQNTRPK